MLKIFITLILSIYNYAFNSSINTNQNIFNTPIFNGGVKRLIPVNYLNITIPLKYVNVNIKIQQNIARVEIEQEYENTSPHNLQTDYYFPISESSVFDSFEAVLGNKTINGEIKEKDDAREQFERAISEGSTATLTEITRTKDVMKVTIGNFLPGQKINLRYSYLELLDVTQSKYWRLIIFSTLTPLYSPEGFTSPPISNVKPDISTYKWTINTEIITSSPITELNVPSHSRNIIISYWNNKKYTKISLDPSQEYDPNKNFEIYYSTTNDHLPQLVVEEYIYPTQNKDLVGYISFFPQFFDTNLTSAGLANNTLFNLTEQEFIFIVDRSGSMQGDRINKLKKSLTEFLNNLPENSYFNIISFGSIFKPLYEKSVLVKNYKKDALKKIKKFDANFGGTEILEPMRYAFKMSYINDYPRIIFLLTDGDVTNTDQIINLTRENKNRSRVNTIGIGSGASNYLIRGVANAGQGTYDFVSDDQDLVNKVINTLKSSISPYLTNFDLNFSNDKAIKSTYPRKNELQFVLKNNVLIFFFFINSSFDLRNENLQVKISFYDSFAKTLKNFNLSLNDSEIIKGEILHKFSIKKQIDALNTEVKLKKFNERIQIIYQIVNLSIIYKVLSEYTAFVLTIQENGVFQPATHVLIPNIESKDYSLSFNGQSLGRFLGGRGRSTFIGGSHEIQNTNRSNIPSAIIESSIKNTSRAITTQENSTSLITKLHKIIPHPYWTSNNNITLKTFNNTYLECDESGNLSWNNKNLTLNAIWIPHIIKDQQINLKSLYGTYLSFNDTYRNCSFDKNNLDSILNILRNETIIPFQISILNANGNILQLNKFNTKSQYFSPPINDSAI